MFAAALGRQVRNGPFKNFQKRLLHAFTRHIARDGGVVPRLARNLVNFVNIDDAAFGARNVLLGSLNQRKENVLDILAGGVDSALRGLALSSTADLGPEHLLIPEGFDRSLGVLSRADIPR